MAMDFYLWLAPPLFTGTELLRLVKNMVPIGAGPFLFVDGVRDYAVPILIAIPGALVVLCVLLFRFLTRSTPSVGTATSPADRAPDEEPELEASGRIPGTESALS